MLPDGNYPGFTDELWEPCSRREHGGTWRGSDGTANVSGGVRPQGQVLRPRRAVSSPSSLLTRSPRPGGGTWATGQFQNVLEDERRHFKLLQE